MSRQEIWPFDPLGRAKVMAGSDHYFLTHVLRPSVPPRFSKSRKTKQFSSENNDQHWRDVCLAEGIINGTLLGLFLNFFL